MLEGFGQGLSTVLSPTVLLYIFIGVIVGFVVGILPGLGAMTTIAIILPFIWKASPQTSLALLMGLCAAPLTAGAVTAILLNIPGEDCNVTTTLDGYPLNQRGEGGRAIVIAVTASTAGGLGAVFMALIMIPMTVPIVMAFTFAELFFMILMGLAFIATLSSRNVTKGLISGGLGILLSLIGFHATTGITRFTFGSLFLYDGLYLPVFLMGLFGLSEMIDLIFTEQTMIAKTEVATLKFKDVYAGIKDVMSHKWLLLRSTVLGYIVGVIPGIGAQTATWLAYGQARQISENPEKFGTGAVEGIIAAQSSMAATTAGALLTTMIFGIPGAAIMAIIMGGFLMVGITPGPMLVKEHLDLAFTLILGVAVACVMVAILCMGTAKYMARIAALHLDYLLPIIMIIVYVAAFVTHGEVLDFAVVVLAAVLGFLAKRFDYSRAALCLGYVLGKLFEHYLLMSTKAMGPLFFLRPICLVIIAIIVLQFCYRPLMRMIKNLAAKGKEAYE